MQISAVGARAGGLYAAVAAQAPRRRLEVQRAYEEASGLTLWLQLKQLGAARALPQATPADVALVGC